MTTIILVTIGILLAGVAALFMIFYGGDAFTSSDDKAEATRLIGEGVQVQAAFQAFRAQEDRMPGRTGTGVDAAALWDLHCPNSDGVRYLNQIPKGVGTQPVIDCDPAKRPAANATSASPWKIDYNYGIARSVIGDAKNSDGTDSRAYGICQAARKQIGLTSPAAPMRCDDAGISNKEPCCIMSAADANL